METGPPWKCYGGHGVYEWEIFPSLWVNDFPQWKTSFHWRDQGAFLPSSDPSSKVTAQLFSEIASLKWRVAPLLWEIVSSFLLETVPFSWEIVPFSWEIVLF